jgi:ribosomal protein L29
MEALGTAEEESQKTVASKGELWRYRLSADIGQLRSPHITIKLF